MLQQTYMLKDETVVPMSRLPDAATRGLSSGAHELQVSINLAQFHSVLTDVTMRNKAVILFDT